MTKSEQLLAEGGELKDMREVLGLSRDELAQRLGIASVTLRNAEAGRTRLAARKFEVAKKLCAGAAASPPSRPGPGHPPMAPANPGGQCTYDMESIISRALEIREDAEVSAAAKLEQN